MPDYVRRPLTVADSVRMTRFGDASYTAGGSSKGIVGRFSPDRARFVIVLRSGNLERNTNEYSLVLFRTADAFHSPKPRLLVSLTSSSNRPAIKNIVWLGDNDTILFLGEGPGERTELYSFKCSSGELQKLTNHPTNLVSFAVTAKGDRIVYAAETPPSAFVTASALRYGIRVKHQLLSDLIRGSSSEFPDYELFVQEPGTGEIVQARIDGQIEFPSVAISLSPDGKYFAVQTEARQIPRPWKQYTDRSLQILTPKRDSEGTRTRVYQYELVDTRTGASKLLLDAPINPNLAGSEVVWSPDGQSLVISNMYSPWNVNDPTEQAIRKSHAFLIEIKVPSLEFLTISGEDLRLIDWDAKTSALICEVGRIDSLLGKPVRRVLFRKNDGAWHQVAAPENMAATHPDIVLDENLNKAPQIVAFDPATGRKSLLMDLNPQFANLSLGKVEEVKWRDALGNEVNGGLYWPPDYVEGKKYPLVIQTHGFTPSRFWVDGPWTTAFAAQPLAAEGFFVLQAPDPDGGVWDTPEEAPRAMAVYEGAIDYLDRKGIIDRSRVGLIGFSRTCLYVVYTLAHSKHHFAAAAIADGINAGYFAYMAFSNSYPAASNEIDMLNGAPPFGDGLFSWMKRSPAFLMGQVQTPLRIQAIGPASLLENWDWFSGMSRLDKPVDMIYIPDGTHILEKPWDRMVSQQGNVDWFCFWLKSEEDPDPAKAEQYTRWRELRKLQEENQKKAAADSAPTPH